MRVRFAVVVLAVLVGACQRVVPPAEQPAAEQPAAEILAPRDGARVEPVEDLDGRVRTAGNWPVVVVRPLHVADSPWYVQPEVMTINEHTFTSRVYLGDDATTPGTRFELTVLLAKDRAAARQYKEGQTLAELPQALVRSKTVTVHRAADAPAKQARTLSFAGREWEVKAAALFDPGPNAWGDGPENVAVDDKGHLRLALTQRDGKWHCAEVVGPSLGYGEYTWVVAGDLAALDPQAVLGLFVYRDERHEIDFELSRWGDAAKPNAQFVIQPPTRATLHRFETGQAKVLTCSFSWQEDLVWGRCWAGEDKTQPPLADWKYTGARIPRPGGERARMNLWLFGGKAPAAGKQEVVIRSFQFAPAPQ